MTQAMKIAIIDDEQDMRQSISQWLALSGYDTETFASAEDALKVLGPDYPGIVISDIKMPGMDGMQFLKKLMGTDSSLPVIMITGHGDVPMAVEAMRVGAYDFLEKPFNPDRMTEAFGLYALSGKATTFLAPAAIAIVSDLTNSQRMGITPIIVLFVLGLMLLLWVKPKGDFA